MTTAGQGVNQRWRFNLAGGIILLAGLGCALWIYLAAQNDLANAPDGQDEPGYAYTLNPEHSKKFLHDMEVYGGKANVLMYKFRVWFMELWTGTSLAFTIAFLSVLISGLAFYIGGFFQSPPDLNSQDKRTG